jgi:hypothetical protein
MNTVLIIIAGIVAFDIALFVLLWRRRRPEPETVEIFRDHYVTAVIYHDDYPRLRREIGGAAGPVVSAHRYTDAPHLVEVVLTFFSGSPHVAERLAARALERIAIEPVSIEYGAKLSTLSAVA